MNKELEALYRLTSHECMTAEEFDSLVAIIKQALTPPTEQEVCEALSEQLKATIVIRKNKHGITFNYVETKKTIISLNYNLLNIKVQLPSRLITMIGKFYEGKVKE